MDHGGVAGQVPGPEPLADFAVFPLEGTGRGGVRATADPHPAGAPTPSSGTAGDRESTQPLNRPLSPPSSLTEGKRHLSQEPAGPEGGGPVSRRCASRARWISLTPTGSVGGRPVSSCTRRRRYVTVLRWQYVRAAVSVADPPDANYRLSVSSSSSLSCCGSSRTARSTLRTACWAESGRSPPSGGLVSHRRRPPRGRPARRWRR